MVVDRLEHRLPGGQQLQVLLHDLHVITVRVQCREWQPLAFLAIIAMVIIHTQGRDSIGAQRVHQPLGQRGLSGSAVAGDREHHRPRCAGASPLHSQQFVGHDIPLFFARPRKAPQASIGRA